MENMIVRHSSKTQDEKAQDGSSWIDFWQKTTKRGIPEICPCCKETPNEKNPMVGAHVEEYILSGYIDKPRYITPTCKKCNDTYKGQKCFHPFKVDKSDLLEIEA